MTRWPAEYFPLHADRRRRMGFFSGVAHLLFPRLRAMQSKGRRPYDDGQQQSCHAIYSLINRVRKIQKIFFMEW